ncbi:sushi domain-containing protein 5-like [Scleropages formosus]|uniref:Sushi domain-containing protein 5-like n=1 Tax=Scleropages formosus TaxID=113540 RepID=A0A0P7TJK8_SCLFO|nr:sushi domain-containing protein 5-like [Scleropages formosus]
METLGSRTRTLLVLLFLGTCGRTVVLAEGWLFLVETHNAPVLEDRQAAQEVCERHGARLASAEELKEAVGRCSFPSCTRGWLAGPAVGTIICDHTVRGQQGKKAAHVKVENVTVVTRQMDIFCFKDQGVAVCGDPPSFPHVLLQTQTGSEMGDELTYTCAPGYTVPSGQSTFSLLCNSCGEWYGQVQLCVKDAFSSTLHCDHGGGTMRSHRFSHNALRREERKAKENSAVRRIVAAVIMHLVFTTSTYPARVPGQTADLALQPHWPCPRSGETEVQVDYEDKFPGEGRVSYEDSDGREETSPSETEDYEPEQGLGERRGGRPGTRTPRPEEQQRVEAEDVDGERDTQPPSVSTESSVSLLSQKHLFWFPSETFHEPERPGVTRVTGVVGVTVAPAWEEDNRIGVRSSGSMEDIKEDIKALDVAKTGPQNHGHEGLREHGAGTDESWLDGYPVTEEAREKEEEEEDDEGRPGAGSTAEEKDGGLEDDRRTDGPNHVETGQPQRSSSAPSAGFTRVTVSPTRPVRYGIKYVPAGPAPASTAHGGDVDLQPSARHPLPIHLSTTAAPPTVPWPTTDTLYPLLDHMPSPTKWEEVTLPYQEAPPGGATTDSSHRFPGTRLYEEPMKRNLTQRGPEPEAPPTQEPCVGEGCSLTGRGPVAVIVGVALCVLLAAAALTVWCCKKRQQKSSVYKMNGQGQSGTGSQHIEMQQKV